MTTVRKASAERLTILQCAEPLVMAKTWRADGSIKQYDKAKYFTVELVEVSGIRDLSEQLTRLGRQRRACVIRGEPRSGLDIDAPVLRRVSNFTDVPRHAVMIEVDGFEPVGDSPLSNPIAALREYIEVVLPECFKDVTFHWQLSNSAGHVTKGDTLRVHLWFWLATAYSGAKLKRWAEGLDLELDRSVFHPIQVHYTSAPMFEMGVSDPIDQRSGLIEGDRDEVDLEIPAEEARPERGRVRPLRRVDPRVADLRAEWLEENWPSHGRTSAGAVIITCPFDEEHTSGRRGDTSTVYLPAGTGGHALGHYKCYHNHCSGRAQPEFDEAVGYEGPPVLDRADPLTNSRVLADLVFTDAGRRTLVRAQGEWLRYTGARYAELSDEDLRSEVWRFLGASERFTKGNPAPFQPAMQHVTGVVDALRSVVGVAIEREPSWLPGFNGPNPRQVISLENGLLDLTKRNLLPHTPGFFTRNTLPFSWTAELGAPRKWLRFLDEVFNGDEDQIGTLQEVVGYLLTPDTSQQKIFLIIGPKRSGKGTIARVIEGLLGPQNVAAPTLDSLTKDFGCEPLIGKLLALVPDARTSGQMNKQAVIERLLNISGEDRVTVNRKNIAHWTGHLPTRILIMTNELLVLPDASSALVGRLLLLETQRTFFNHEDSTLGDKLAAELPQILGWAIDGFDRLNARGRFLQPKAGRAQLEALLALNSPIMTFVQMFCDLGRGQASLEALYAAWSGWRERLDQSPGGIDQFSRNLTANHPELRRRRPRDGAGVQKMVFEGISLKPDVAGRAMHW
jgi:P4 family phage/plasmid primase-like protien